MDEDVFAFTYPALGDPEELPFTDEDILDSADIEWWEQEYEDGYWTHDKWRDFLTTM